MGDRHCSSSWLVLGIAVLLLPPPTAHGQTGDLDSAFGVFGVATTNDIGAGVDHAYAMTLDPTGRIVMVGSASDGAGLNFGISRFLPGGTLDPAFGIGGATMFDLGSDFDIAYAVAVQPDGRIIVAGRAEQDWTTDMAIIRLNDDGSLDSSFAENGVRWADFGPGSDYARSILLRGDGRVIVVGYAHDGSTFHTAVVQLLADGSFDGSFSGDGRIMLMLSPEHDATTAAILLPDGRILLAGNAGDPSDFFVARMNTDGTLDTSFGVGGVSTADALGTNDVGLGLAIGSDGRIVVSGSAHIGLGYHRFAVARFLQNGSPDTTFSTDGVTTATPGPLSNQGAGSVVQPDGKVLMCGNTNIPSNSNFGIVRFNVDGSLDTTFSADGMLAMEVAPYGNYAWSVALQGGGILVGGSSTNALGHTRFTVVRLMNDINVGVFEPTSLASAILVYPNPINAASTFTYTLTKEESLTLQVFDATGRVARSLFSNAKRPLGEHRETLDLSGLAAANYTVVLSSAEGSVSVKVVKE